MNSEWEDPDVLLDHALREYAAQEPPVGLAGRVMRRTREQPPRRPWWMLAWIPAIAFAGFYLMVGNPEKPVPPKVAATVVTESEPVASPVLVVARRRRPKPASGEDAEQTLIRFVQTNPAAAIAALGESQHKEIEPLVTALPEIEPIQIEELKITEDLTK